MGFLTTITIHNDALGSFEKNPEKFGQSILHGINEASIYHKQVDVGFDGYANYITVQPPRHAEDRTVYLHSGNTVTDLNQYDKEFESLIKKDPKLAKEWLKQAKAIIDGSLKKLKDVDG